MCVKLTLFFSGKTCLSLRCSPFNLLPVILEVRHRGGAPHNSLLHMPTNGCGMCMQHSLSCVLPACASNDTWLRSSMAFSHKSVSWQLRHSVSLYRGPFTYERCSACSALAWNITEVQSFNGRAECCFPVQHTAVRIKGQCYFGPFVVITNPMQLSRGSSVYLLLPSYPSIS